MLKNAFRDYIFGGVYRDKYKIVQFDYEISIGIFWGGEYLVISYFYPFTIPQHKQFHTTLLD